MEGLIVLLVAGGIGLAIYAAVQYQRKVDAAWRDAAGRLGLTYTTAALFSKRRMVGELDGCHVIVEVYRRSSGKHSESFTRYRVSHPEPLGLGLRLKREGLFSGVSKFFGSQDIELGDPQFDQAVMVKGADPASVASFLTPSRRMRILRLFEAFDRCEVRDDLIQWSRRGTETSAEALVSVTRRLAQTARALAAGEPVDDKLDAALLARREGRLDDALALAREAAATVVTPDPEPGLLEQDLLTTAEAAATPAPGPQTGEPDSLALCRDLFEGDGLSLQVDRRFEERYRGRTVRWTGVMRSVRSYAFDLVFGKEPGVRMVVDLHEVKSGVFGRMVQAVVQLPKGAEEALKEKVDDEVTFEGTLVRCDAFARNLFVAGGAVV